MTSEEVTKEIIQQTQKILGKYVKKPQLSEKLLTKPPFRFLHDIVRVVVQETGFLRGLYSSEELVSDNVKEREKKIAFLNKLIEATKAISGTELTVKSSKIVAGLEPTQTNLLLQTIGKCIDKRLDSNQYIQQLKHKSKPKISDVEGKTKKPNESIAKNRQKPKEVIAKEKGKKESSNKNLIENKKRADEKKKVKKGDGTPKKEESPEQPKILSEKETKNDDAAIKKRETVIEDSNKQQVDEIEEQKIEISEIESATTENKLNASNSGDLDNIVQSEIANTTNDETEIITETKPTLIRPKSARPKSGNLNKQNKEELITEPLPSNTLRPPSVRPSSARPGAPRLRPDSALPLKEPVTMGKINVIVEHFDKIDDPDEETVIIENTPVDIEEIKPQTDLDLPQEKGQLVEEILKQIGDEEVQISSNEWQIDSFRNKSATKDIEQLRNSIQTLTRIANPFGKLISYLHEDVETMYNELNMWKNMKRQTYGEIKKHEKMREELCKPLQEQLSNLEMAIKKQEDDILNIRAKIIRNDSRIKQLLSQLV